MTDVQTAAATPHAPITDETSFYHSMDVGIPLLVQPFFTAGSRGDNYITSPALSQRDKGICLFPHKLPAAWGYKPKVPIEKSFRLGGQNRLSFFKLRRSEEASVFIPDGTFSYISAAKRAAAYLSTTHRPPLTPSNSTQRRSSLTFLCS